MRWVALQLALMGAVVASGLRTPRRRSARLHLLAGVALGAGGALAGAGSRVLGSDLRARPEPREGAPLHVDRVYAAVRHPMYGGFVLLALGWALARGPRVLPAAAALAVFLDRKARREEHLLERVHPGYAEYRRRTPNRLLPWI